MHDLTQRKNGFVEMAYTGKKPWHGLGQALAQGASIEEWQKAAGMDWQIKRSKMRYAVSSDPAAALVVDDSIHVLFRSDTSAKLGIVGGGFKVVQPHEVLEFFRGLAGAAGFELCTAGTLGGGKRFWAQAEANMKDTIVGADVVESKLLVATACDGTMNTVVKRVVERVVCANTIAIALSEKGKEFRLSHRSEFKPEDAKKALGLAEESFHSFVLDARELSKADVGPELADKFLIDLMTDYSFTISDGQPAEEHAVKLDAARSSAGYKKVLALFNGEGRGSQAKGVSGTAWGLLNAVTEYVDHHRGRSNDTRMSYAWFGPGDALKTAAMKQALKMIRA